MTGQACHPIHASAAAAPNQPLRVLFVEDCEDDMALLLIALGEEFGAVAHARVDSATALRRALRQQPWDLILCDHRMPTFDAPAALAIVRQHDSAAPFVIVSGSISDAAVAAAMKAGAADMIHKGALVRLAPAVRRALKSADDGVALGRARQQLQQLACFDEQTGLPKRALLEAQLAACGGGEACPLALALAVVELAGMSQLARAFGQAAADDALRLVGLRLRACVGSDGMLVSLGHDRFALLFGGAPAGGGAALAARINDAVATPLTVGGRELFVAVRIGIRLRQGRCDSAVELLASAEGALGQVGAGDLPNYAVFEAGLQAACDQRWALCQEVHRAVRARAFSLHYQPQFDRGRGCMVGVEALLRWYRPDGSVVTPAEFIPLLEESGLIVELGEWVLRTACLQGQAWRDAGLAPLKIAVNLSALQFRGPQLVPMVQRVLAETGFDSAFLELEITENVAMHDRDGVIDKLTGLRALGVRLSIDDFGTGFSSLSYLQRFPVHALKIDQSFIHQISDATPDSPMVAGIVSLAHHLGIHVIAEGVETAVQERFLLGCGCNEMQGFRFSRPLPPHEVTALLAAADGVAGA